MSGTCFAINSSVWRVSGCREYSLLSLHTLTKFRLDHTPIGIEISRILNTHSIQINLELLEHGLSNILNERYKRQLAVPDKKSSSAPSLITFLCFNFASWNLATILNRPWATTLSLHFSEKNFFFLKNFGRFSHKGGPLPPKTKKNHIRGDPYLRNHIFSRSWKDVWFDCKRFISYQKHRESRECRIEKSLTFHKLTSKNKKIT